MKPDPAYECIMIPPRVRKLRSKTMTIGKIVTGGIFDETGKVHTVVNIFVPKKLK
jgi:hypothetical protein